MVVSLKPVRPYTITPTLSPPSTFRRNFRENTCLYKLRRLTANFDSCPELLEIPVSPRICTLPRLPLRSSHKLLRPPNSYHPPIIYDPAHSLSLHINDGVADRTCSRRSFLIHRAVDLCPGRRASWHPQKPTPRVLLSLHWHRQRLKYSLVPWGSGNDCRSFPSSR